MHLKTAIAFAVYLCGSLVMGGCVSAPLLDEEQTANQFRVAKDEYGNPDLNGIWQALGTAHYDVEPHAARMGAVVAMGATGAIPAGLGVVVGGSIPYQDWALSQRDENRANWLARDPAVKCFMPGIPRATYMPLPFQIIQGDKTQIFAYEYASAARVVYMDRPDFEHPFEAWMGHSRGRWEGDTLVIRVDAHVPDTWFDQSGNFHSEALVVEERYTLVSDNVLHYEATMTDENVYTRPWQISMPLYRRLEPNAQLLEFKCVEFAEELMYGHLVKKPAED
ncbi:MAG: hypothetical protein P8L31_03590 [Pseudomonadales bacterium]|nr:hypothetical protein [Pseudomonadales bacterium]